MKTSSLELIVINRLNALKFPPCEREYHWHPTRKFRSDFVWKKEKIIIEAEGGIWQNMRHNRAPGFINDCIKYNEAQLLGYTVYRITTGNLDDLEKIKFKYFSEINLPNSKT